MKKTEKSLFDKKTKGLSFAVFFKKTLYIP